MEEGKGKGNAIGISAQEIGKVGNIIVGGEMYWW
jgi:hypothetical protein